MKGMRPASARCAVGMMVVCAASLANAALPESDGQESLATSVNLRMDLAHSMVFAADIQATVGEALTAVLPVDGLPMLLDLLPVSVRAESYKVLTQAQDGTLVSMDPGPVRTLRGEVVGFPDSNVTGSLFEDGLHVHVVIPGMVDYWIEPLESRLGKSARGLYVGYHDDDALTSGGTCGSDAASMTIAPAVGEIKLDGDDGGIAGGGPCVAQLACDADFEYFQDWGSVANVEARINNIVNTVNNQYEAEVGITHLISAIIVRTAEPDPYSSTDAATLLNQFRNHWNANQSGITRDLAQLFTGKELNSSTIGIAWLSAVCSNYGYSLVQSDFSNTFACVTDLSAHELGHNWGADHCSCSSYTMNPFITCANQFHPSLSIPQITSFRDSCTCLSDCGGGGGGDPVDAPLTGFEITIGTLTGGNLASLDNSDNAYITIASAAQANKHRAETVVHADSPITTVSQLALTVETGASVSNVKTSIYLFNFSSNGWTKLTTINQPTGDTVTTFASIVNPNNYVDNSGEVRVRVFFQRNGGGAYTARVDHVQVTATP